MRDPVRIEPLLKLIKEIWTRHPDLRLGQLLDCAREEVDHDIDMFYVEDELLRVGLEALEERCRLL